MDNRPFFVRLREAKLANRKFDVVNAGLKEKRTKETEEKQQRAQFFEDMINEAPRCCTECGGGMAASMFINPRSVIAHILPKRLFKSVQFNPLNAIYLCVNCHTNLDNGGERKVRKMRIFPLIISRLSLLASSIDDDEKRHIPTFYLTEKIPQTDDIHREFPSERQRIPGENFKT